MTRGRFLFLLATVVVVCAVVLGNEPSAQTGKPIDPEGSCVTSSCHDGITAKANVHIPAAAGDECAICHEMTEEGKHRFALAAKGSELCFTCHDEDEFAGKTTHGPVGEGLCTKCHNPHASDHDGFLRAATPDLCFSCHNRTLKDAKGQRLPSPKRTFQDQAMKLHPPFKEGECLACHLPHVSDNRRLLVENYPQSIYVNFSTEKYVCFMCHDDEAFTEPRTTAATNFRNGNLNLHYRHVNRKKGRSCKSCHHHHGAANEALIRGQVPFGKRGIVISEFSRTKTGGSCSPMCHITVSYDRFDPVLNKMKVTPRRGTDATLEELKKAREGQSGE